MKITVQITKDNGEVIEISQGLVINSSRDVIREIEQELSKLKVELLPLLSETLLSKQQELFSSEKKNT